MIRQLRLRFSRPMEVPQRIYEIVLLFYNDNVLMAQGTDNQVRKLTEMMVEQIAYEFGPKWSLKESGTQRSKAAIMYCDPVNVWAYYWQNPISKRPASPPEFEYSEIDRTLLVAVERTDHLGVSNAK